MEVYEVTKKLSAEEKLIANSGIAIPSKWNSPDTWPWESKRSHPVDMGSGITGIAAVKKSLSFC